jgi:hypothetical protein
MAERQLSTKGQSGPGDDCGGRLRKPVRGGYDEEGPIMAKGQRRTSREARKPKKAGPPKQNASTPSLKGMPASPSPSPSVKKG